MSQRSKIGGVLGLAAGLCMKMFGKRSRQGGETQKKLDFSTSSQRMGVRFTEKVRNRFRERWLRKG